jgi:hypothetical protein
MYGDIRTQIISTLSKDSFWMINKKLTLILGIETALLTSELISKDFYYSEKNEEYNGWFYHTNKRIEENTTLTRHKQERCISILKDFKLISTKRKGNPAKRFFKIHYNNYETLLRTGVPQIVKKRQQECKEFTDKSVKNLHSHIIINNNINNNKGNNNIVAQKIVPRKNDKNKCYLPLAKNLGEIITTKKNIKINSQKLNSWVNSIRLLVETDGVQLRRVKKALRWYRFHSEDEYVPVIESGKTLREKFIRLENAIERSKNIITTKNVNKTGFVGKNKLNYKKPEVK